MAGEERSYFLSSFAAEETIDFAYPTQRFYDNATEGKKPGMVPGA